MNLRTLFACAGAVPGLVAACFSYTAAAQAGAVLSPADHQDIARIEAYLQSIDTLQAAFLQTSSDGRMAAGVLYLDRPGRLRMDYAPPVQVDVIATGTRLIYHDKEPGQVWQVPLAATPAAVLLDKHPKLLGGAVTVTHVEHVGSALTVKFVQTSYADAGSLLLGLSTDPLVLRRLVLTDAEGTELIVSLMDHQLGGTIDPELFRFSDSDDARGSE
jgi:outer membrane lipoprotein-sorting protein